MLTIQMFEVNWFYLYVWFITMFTHNGTGLNDTRLIYMSELFCSVVAVFICLCYICPLGNKLTGLKAARDRGY